MSLQLKIVLLGLVSGASIDCLNVINLARGLDMQTAQAGIWSQLQIDCCNVGAGITCTSQRVTQIDWHNKGLSGVINGTAIPSLVTLLFLFTNQISGNVPSALPNVIQYLDLSNNLLTGSIPTVYPLSLKELYLENNKLSGDLPAFPPNLICLHLAYPGYPDGNRFSWTLRLNTPIEIYINDNWITDVILTDRTQMTSNCDLSYNPMLGNPNIAVLTMCARNGLYSATLLPFTNVKMSTTRTTNIRISTIETSRLLTSNILTSLPSTVLVMTTTESLLTPSPSTFIVLEQSTILKSISTSTASLRTTKPVLNTNLNTIETLAQSTHLSSISSMVFIKSLQTVQFQIQETVFIISISMVLRLVTNVIVLVIILCKTPFKREFKRKLTSFTKKGTTSDVSEF